ncbi:MAG: hypothetical protein LBC74_08605 [Planctomycetaceae bacterium]|jgi:phage gp16-like protein|nr:hypothetical protein [Planctomycetaceae bacterium]
MQTPEQVLDTYFLDTRYALLEVAAMFDRYDDAVARAGGIDAVKYSKDTRRTQLEEAVKILTNCSEANRAETMLNHFSEK